MFPFNRTHPPLFDLVVLFQCFFRICPLTAPELTFVPHSASVMFSTRRTDTPARYNLDHRFLNTAFLAAVPFDNLCFKCQRPKSGHLQFHFPGLCQEFPFVRPRSRVKKVRTPLYRIALQIASASAFKKSFNVSSTALRNKAVQVVLNFLWIDYD